MTEAVLHDNLLLVLVMWVVIYVSDYYGTLYAARLYQAYVEEHLSFGGSLELTPQFQHDIEHLKTFSPRFLLYLALSLVLISVIWLITNAIPGSNWLFALFVGGILLREAAFLIRHLRNLALFSMAKRPGNLTGRLEYSRRAVLVQSASEMLGFVLLFLFIFAITGSWSLLGAALACAVVALQNWALARKSTRAGHTEADLPA
jgi:hypothetical protein